MSLASIKCLGTITTNETKEGCAEIDLAEVGIRIPASSIPSTAKNLCTEASA